LTAALFSSKRNPRDDFLHTPEERSKRYITRGKLTHLSIPAKLHFCWIGTNLPWAYVFAILSAEENSDLPDIFLHHTDKLEKSAAFEAWEKRSRIHFSRLDTQNLLLTVGTMLGVGSDLHALCARLKNPVAQADVLRAALLYAEGGIYLDLDTVTVASLRPLLEAEQFIGNEHIVWPKEARSSAAPALLARHLGLDIIRKFLKVFPNGWKGFRRMEKYYILGVNNAVMGCEAGSSFMADYLKAMLDLPRERQGERYALGPQLLQDVVERHGSRTLTVHKPGVFYPLPPEISEHWFRRVRQPQFSKVLSPDTRVVHWYASVRTRRLVGEISPPYVVHHRERQLYSALVCANIRAIGQIVAEASPRDHSQDLPVAGT
jgi:hypothetical protein